MAYAVETTVRVWPPETGPGAGVGGGEGFDEPPPPPPPLPPLLEPPPELVPPPPLEEPPPPDPVVGGGALSIASAFWRAASAAASIALRRWAAICFDARRPASSEAFAVRAPSSRVCSASAAAVAAASCR